MNNQADRLKQCKKYKDFEKFLKDEGFEHSRTSGGHNEYTKPGVRSIPIPTHGKEPSKNLRFRIVREIKIAIGIFGSGCFFFFIIYPNMFNNIA